MAMCPVCAANAAIVVAGVGSTGAFASFALKILGLKRNTRKLGSKKITQGRDEHGYADEKAGAVQGGIPG
jgi:hypothetical protein